MLRTLFCCCASAAAADDVSVIPDETTHLIPKVSSLTPDSLSVLDHQKLQDRMSTIVRAKQGKMVNVAARTPFTVQTAPPTPSAVPDPDPAGDTNTLSPTETRRPQVLTMTPAASRGSWSLNPSRYSSPNPSRSSSRKRPASESSDRAERTRSEAQPPPPLSTESVPVKRTALAEDDIAFSWSDT
ncbi:hypothetical protein FB45DRAFT_906652 [Roridomyces roridus]|uniref:Uncharacterized protein n=1 Tax=Roridomyces roridus TaxID=1738132 RepID=A0AAD7C1K0_9AGAR|nr:hypothetical protein FB45DRAFT_906652 [Roridomyces roridus]